MVGSYRCLGLGAGALRAIGRLLLSMCEDCNLENRVTVEVSDGVAEVRLVRATKLNALDLDMFEALA